MNIKQYNIMLWIDDIKQLGLHNIFKSSGKIKIINNYPSYTINSGNGYSVEYYLKIAIKKYKKYLQRKKEKEKVKILQNNYKISNRLCNDIFKHIQTFL